MSDENAPEESNLVVHARRELELIGEEPETIDDYLRVVRAFCSTDISDVPGISVSVLTSLLLGQNLAPITDNPQDWIKVGPNTWQNRRNGEAFSENGGTSYYLLSECANGNRFLRIPEKH